MSQNSRPPAFRKSDKSFSNVVPSTNKLNHYSQILCWLKSFLDGSFLPAVLSNLMSILRPGFKRFRMISTIRGLSKLANAFDMTIS